MNSEFDFSQGTRGKFVIPADEIRLPHYLEARLDHGLQQVAKRTGKTPDEVLALVLEKELSVLNALTPQP